MFRSQCQNQAAESLFSNLSDSNSSVQKNIKKLLNKLEKLAIKLISLPSRIYNKITRTKFKLVINLYQIGKKHRQEVPILTIFGDRQSLFNISWFKSDRNYVNLNLFICDRGKDIRSQLVTNLMLGLSNSLDRNFLGRIFLIPVSREDILTSIAIKDRFDVLLCTYLRENYHIYNDSIAEDLEKLLQKSDLRLGISPELCQTYEIKYNLKFWYLPTVVRGNLIQKQIRYSEGEIYKDKGILLGDIASKKCLNELQNTLRGSGITLDWYGNKKINLLSELEKAELTKDGIIDRGDCFKTELNQKLAGVNYAVIAIEESKKNKGSELREFKLLSDLTYIIGNANLPIVVIGNKDNTAAKFVERHKIGTVCDYDRASFQEAVSYVNEPRSRKKMRYFAAKLGKMLSSKGVEKWIWESLKWGRAADLRYENLEKTVKAADIIITCQEISKKHSTGALITRIFANNNNIISIRSNNNDRAKQEFGNLSIWLKNEGLSRQEIFEEVLRFLGNSEIERVFCTPDSREELIWAIAIKESFDVPIVTYIIDDRNYYLNNIPDALMEEFLSKCSLRLVTNPELRDAYEGKYGLKFWLLPPIVADSLIDSTPNSPDPKLLASKTGALLVNSNNLPYLEAIANTLTDAKINLDWYGNKDDPSLEKLATKKLNNCNILPETELAQKLLKYPYIIVPVGTVDVKELSLSLPSEITFISASTNTPIIVMGSKQTPAANFLDRFGIGVTCDYDGASLARAVDYLTKAEIQAQMRQKAASIAANFSDRSIENWLWQSLELGEPVDKKFEELMPRKESDLVVYVEPPIPKTVSKDFIKLYQVMRRLVNRGFAPNFIIDVGCSYGIWSSSISTLFPQARFIAIDPLVYRYQYEIRNHHLSLIPNLEILPIAVGDRVGVSKFQVSQDLYGSSLLNPADFRTYETIEVQVNTLDNLSKEKNITGKGILKLDVQCGEHLVLEGANNFVKQVDILVAELSLVKYDPQALTWTETIAAIEGLGFRYYDETDEWRSPVDGTLLQKEAVFIRQDLFLPEIGQVKQT